MPGALVTEQRDTTQRMTGRYIFSLAEKVALT